MDNSSRMELITEIADMFVMQKIGESAIKNLANDLLEYTEEAQEIFNSVYDKLECLFDRRGVVVTENRAPQKGDDVTIVIPFIYTLGEPSYTSENILNTVEDCKAEVRRELANGFPYGGLVGLDVIL